MSHKGLQSHLPIQQSAVPVEKKPKQTQPAAQPKSLQDTVRSAIEAGQAASKVTGRTFEVPPGLQTPQNQGVTPGPSPAPVVPPTVENTNLASANVQQNVETAQGEEEEFTLDPVGEIDSTDFTDPVVTNADFRNLIEGLKESRKKLIAATRKTPEQLAIETKLADLRQDIDAKRLAFQGGLDELEDQTILQPLIVGQQLSLQKQFLRQRAVLLADESNLLRRLGLFEDARALEEQVAETELGFLEDDLNLFFKIQDTISKQKKDAFNQRDKLEDNARQVLDDIMDSLEGRADFDDLTLEDQRQIEKLARVNGIPINTLILSLEAAKSQHEFDNLLKERKEARAQQAEARRASESKILPPTQFNIKAGLVGLTEQQATDIFTSEKPPLWFQQAVENEFNQSILPERLQALWTKYKDEVNAQAIEAAKSTGGIDIVITQDDIAKALAG